MVGGRLAAGAALWAVLGVVTPAPARALPEPQWVTDLRNKADGWKRELDDALHRLDGAAAAAGARLAADARRHLDELLALLHANANAARKVLADNAAAYRAVVAARLHAAAQVAGELERELAEVLAGTRTQIDLDVHRLVTGARDVVSATLHDAGVVLADAQLVDGEVVARATAEAEREARRWAWLVLAGGGLVVAAAGLGLIWQRRLPGDAGARRWLASAAGLVVVGAGVAGLVVGVARWRRPASATAVTLGVQRCDALEAAQTLVNRGSATGSERTAATAGLERCVVLIADTASAELVADRLHRVRQLPVTPVTPGGSP